MRVIIKEPGWPAYESHIQNDLKSFQRIVKGHIQAVTVFSDLAIICNDEGRILGMPHNCTFLGMDFVGPIIVVGVDGDEFTDCPIPVSGRAGFEGRIRK